MSTGSVSDTEEPRDHQRGAPKREHEPYSSADLSEDELGAHKPLAGVRKKRSRGAGGGGADAEPRGAHKEGRQSQRNAANARERARMRVLSRAFSRLKTSLPWVPADTKLSKLDTLRLASSYISHLRRLLQEERLESAFAQPVGLVRAPRARARLEPVSSLIKGTTAGGGI
uniref:Musculin n=1 Tax=Scleropages formosus TaxID=113540 RepID=A0A8C9VIV6_SCLFO